MLTALGFVNFLMTVHYDAKYREIVKNATIDSSFPVRILKDGQALHINDKKVELVGDQTEITF